MTEEEFNCKLELTPTGSALVPLTQSGHLPMQCQNISVKISSCKTATYDSSVHSWQLDIKYSSLSRKLVWKHLPPLKGSVHIKQNSSLQDVINSAKNDSTIYVEPGSYREHLFINKTLRLVSSSESANTHIFGEVFITAHGVMLQGMTFYPSVNSFSSIKIHASCATILNCRFMDSTDSLPLYSPRPTLAIDCEQCSHLQIVNNYFYGWKQAVVLKNSVNPLVQTNTFRSCETALSIASGSATKVIGNYFMHNMLGIDSPYTVHADEFLNNNAFNGNVIPLYYEGKSIAYPDLQTVKQISEHIRISNKQFVTGICGIDARDNFSEGICLSLKHSASLNGM